MPYQANLLPNTIHRKHLAFVDNAVQVRAVQEGQTQATDFRSLVSGADTQAGFLEQKFVESALNILGRWRMQKNTAGDGSQTLSIALTPRTDVADGNVLQSASGALQWGAVPGRHDAVSIGAANGLSLAGQALSLALATTLQAGAMSNTDKAKLDSLSNYTHPNSGVNAGTYGSASQVAQVTVNAQGHVTSASNVAISFPAHTHTIDDITGLQAALNGKSNVGHTHAISEVSGLQTALNGKSDVGHNHDDRYYTETESDARYSLLGHTHDDRYYTETESDARYSLLGHTHDDRYYTETESDNRYSVIGHTHVISDVSGLQAALNGKSDVGHTHDDRYYTETESDAKYSVIGHTHFVASITGLQTALDGKSNVGHTHAISEVTGLQTALDGKSNTTHTHSIDDVTGLQTALNGKSNVGHTHAISDVSGLQTALDGKSNTGHTHVITDVSGLQTALDGKSNVGHTHSEYVNATSGYGTSLIKAGNTLKSITVNPASALLQISEAFDTIEISAKTTAGNEGKFYRGDGTFQTIQGMTAGTVSTSNSGVQGTLVQASDTVRSTFGNTLYFNTVLPVVVGGQTYYIPAVI
jgi:hypothetical protein